MYKIFKIEWPDDCGPEWLCKANLESCLFSETFITNTPVTVNEIEREPKDAADGCEECNAGQFDDLEWCCCPYCGRKLDG